MLIESASGCPDEPRARSIVARAPAQAMPVLLSVIAGSTDVIGFLGLDGLFTNHITGNLVLLAAHVAVGGAADVAKVLSVPVYMAIVVSTTLLSSRIRARGRDPLRPLLLLQFVLLSGFLGLCLVGGAGCDPRSAIMILAGMLGVAAMAVQNTLVQLRLEDVPPTAMMTGNVTRLAIDAGTLLSRDDRAVAPKSRARAIRTFPLIAAFTAGCGLGAVCEASLGLRAVALPTALALLALLTAGRAPR